MPFVTSQVVPGGVGGRVIESPWGSALKWFKRKKVKSFLRGPWGAGYTVFLVRTTLQCVGKVTELKLKSLPPVSYVTLGKCLTSSERLVPCLYATSDPYLEGLNKQCL